MFKRKKRWGLRLGIANTLLIVLLLLGHAMWTGIASWRLNSRLKALHAAGEPVDIADLQPPTTLIAGNGYNPLVSIGTQVDASTDAARRRTYMDEVGQPLTRFERLRLGERQAELAPLLPQIEAALGLPQLASTTPLQSPLMMMDWSELSRMGAVATLLHDEANLVFDAGDHRTAVRRADQLDRLAAAPETVATAIGYLVGVGVRSRHARVLTDMAPTLKVGPAADAVPPVEVRRVIAGLLDHRPLDAALLRGLRGERVAAIDAMDAMADGRLGGGPTNGAFAGGLNAVKLYAMRPYFMTSALVAVDTLTARIDAYQSPDAPTALARLAAQKTSVTTTSKALYFFSSLLVAGDPTRLAVATYRLKTDRLLAATALACRLFETEQGRRPKSLGELVPAYLPSLPTDPFAAVGTPLKERLNDADPIVWSIGEDLVDDNGHDPQPSANNNYARPKDAVYHLLPRPREFGETTKLLMAIDPDAPIEPSSATTQPIAATQTTTAAPTPVWPDWNLVEALDVHGDAAAFGLTKRRDVLALLADATHSPPAVPSRTPATLPAHMLWGTVTVDGVPWQFRFDTTGVGELQSPGNPPMKVWRNSDSPSNAGERTWR